MIVTDTFSNGMFLRDNALLVMVWKLVGPINFSCVSGALHLSYPLSRIHYCALALKVEDITCRSHSTGMGTNFFKLELYVRTIAARNFCSDDAVHVAIMRRRRCGTL